MHLKIFYKNFKKFYQKYLQQFYLYVILTKYIAKRTSAILCRSGEMADAQDSKSCEGNFMRVQVPPSAP